MLKDILECFGKSDNLANDKRNLGCFWERLYIVGTNISPFILLKVCFGIKYFLLENIFN
jgi:hypothetical protein